MVLPFKGKVRVNSRYGLSYHASDNKLGETFYQGENTSEPQKKQQTSTL
jgi:hypothetical protein